MAIATTAGTAAHGAPVGRCERMYAPAGWDCTPKNVGTLCPASHHRFPTTTPGERQTLLATRSTLVTPSSSRGGAASGPNIDAVCRSKVTVCLAPRNTSTTTSQCAARRFEKSSPVQASSPTMASAANRVNSRCRNPNANSNPNATARRRSIQSSSAYKSGSIVPPCACTIRLAVIGGTNANQDDATTACQARNPDSRTSRHTRRPPVTTLSSNNGSLRPNTVGSASRNTAAPIQACTPIM